MKCWLEIAESLPRDDPLWTAGKLDTRVQSPQARSLFSPSFDRPLLADIRMVANFWLRPGNSHSPNNVLAFLDDSLDNLSGKRVALLRGRIVDLAIVRFWTI